MRIWAPNTTVIIGPHRANGVLKAAFRFRQDLTDNHVSDFAAMSNMHNTVNILSLHEDSLRTVVPYLGHIWSGWCIEKYMQYGANSGHAMSMNWHLSCPVSSFFNMILDSSVSKNIVCLVFPLHTHRIWQERILPSRSNTDAMYEWSQSDEVKAWPRKGFDGFNMIQFQSLFHSESIFTWPGY